MATLRVGIFGQNIAAAMLHYTQLLSLEAARLGHTVYTTSFTATNSALMKMNSRQDVSNSYWWDETLNQQGPALEQSVSYLQLELTRPSVLLFDPGTLDASAAEFSVPVYKAALISVINKLKEMCPDARIALLFASRYGSYPNIYNLRCIRRAQYEVALELDLYTLDMYDLPMLYNFPLTPAEMTSLGLTVMSYQRLMYRLSQIVLAAHALPAYMPVKPVVTRLGTHHVQMAFNDVGRLAVSQPAQLPNLSILRPGGMVEYDQSWLALTWLTSSAGALLRIELQNEEIASGSIVMYPDHDLDGIAHDDQLTNRLYDPVATTAATVI